MNSTIYNAASGIKTHQFGLDSISNNIANVNTIGYRENVPEFKTLFSSAIPSIDANSKLANDFNYGVTAASNAISTEGGSYKNAEGEFNVAYEGKGWFVVGDGSASSATIGEKEFAEKGHTYFTRDGSFTRDANGYIVNSTGHYMMGVDLGKIKNKVYTTKNERDDLKALSSNRLTPIKIPQDLYFKPVATTKVDVAINLNKTEQATNAYYVYQKDGKFDLEKFFNIDANILSTDEGLINAAANNKAVITIKQGNHLKHYTFTYGSDGEDGFTTLKELKDKIMRDTGLSLDVARDYNGHVEQKLALVLKNNSLQSLDVTLGGGFFKKLGLSGATQNFTSGASMELNPNIEYNKDALIEYKGIVFRAQKDGAKGDPLVASSGFVPVDTKGVIPFNDNTTYNLDDLISFDNKIYQRVGASGSGSPKDEKANWKELMTSKSEPVAKYKLGQSYEIGQLANIDGKVYRRINTSGKSNPLDDETNWKVLKNDYFASSDLKIPSYASNTEIYDENGKKYLIKSTYRLVSSGHIASEEGTPKAGDKSDEVWEVTSAIYDKNGEVQIGKSVKSTLAFDGDGQPKSEPVVLKLGDNDITYSLNGTPKYKSTDAAYRDSGVLGVSQDGKQEGRLKMVRIDQDGIINLAFTNGAQEPMGRIGVAAFINPQGLQKVGGNLLQIRHGLINGENAPLSGNPILGWNEDARLKFGSVLYKHLETSNVDVGNSLTQLILMQRGYSMNAKSFTTGDELIKEAINLKR